MWKKLPLAVLLTMATSAVQSEEITLVDHLTSINNLCGFDAPENNTEQCIGFRNGLRYCQNSGGCPPIGYISVPTQIYAGSGNFAGYPNYTGSFAPQGYAGGGQVLFERDELALILENLGENGAVFATPQGLFLGEMLSE